MEPRVGSALDRDEPEPGSESRSDSDNSDDAADDAADDDEEDDDNDYVKNYSDNDGDGDVDSGGADDGTLARCLRVAARAFGCSTGGAGPVFE